MSVTTEFELQSSLTDEENEHKASDSSVKEKTHDKKPLAVDVSDYDVFNLDKFNTEHLYCLVFGISGSGKSHVVREMLHKLCKQKYYRQFRLISPTEKLSHSFKCFGKTMVEEAFSDSYLRDLIVERKAKIMAGSKSVTPLLIVIDDCAADPSMRNSPALNELFISGRHINVGVIILLQNINARDSVPLPIRNNATLLLASRPRKHKDREYLVREWFSLSSEKEGQALLESLTMQEYNFAVVDLQKFATARTYKDFVFQYRAQKKQPVFKLTNQGSVPIFSDDKQTRWRKADQALMMMDFM